MRSLFLLCSCAALALGCGPGPDPALGDCSVRKEGAVILGTGEDEFLPLPSAGVPINYGSQGGQHIWLALSCKNLGPRVAARFKITDVDTGIELTAHGLAKAIDLEYDGKGSDLGYGIYGYLDLSGSSANDPGDGSGGGEPAQLPSDLSGRAIKIEADVSDDCKKPAIHVEVLTKISFG